MEICLRKHSIRCSRSHRAVTSQSRAHCCRAGQYLPVSLRSLDSDIARHDNEIARLPRLHEAITCLKREKERLSIYTGRWDGSMAPIRRLPSEIHASLFGGITSLLACRDSGVVYLPAAALRWAEASYSFPSCFWNACAIHKPGVMLGT